MIGGRARYAVADLPKVAGGEQDNLSSKSPWLRHSFWAYLGLRPALAQHTAAEHETIRKWARGSHCIVEIGVAEGVSGLALREGMADDGVLYLVDPFHLSRVSALNFIKRVAHRTVESNKRGTALWIERFSQEAVRTWKGAIDVILIDGDHAESAVERDWRDWSRFVKVGGFAIFHDARLFERGWTTADYGPVKFVDRVFRAGEEKNWTIVDQVHSLVVVQREEETRVRASEDVKDA